MEKLIQFLVPNSNEAYKILETLRGLADKGEIKLHRVSVVEKAMDGKAEMRHVHESKGMKHMSVSDKDSTIENITENVKDLFSKSVSFIKNTFSKDKSEKGESSEACADNENCVKGDMAAKGENCENAGKNGKCESDSKGAHHDDFIKACQEACYGEEKMTKMSEKIPYGKTAVFAWVDEEWGAAIDSKLSNSAEISRMDIGEELKKAGDERMAKLDEDIKTAKSKLAEAADEDMEKVKAEYDKLVKYKNKMAEKFRNMLDSKNADGKSWFAKFKEKAKDIGENIAEKAGDMKDAISDKTSDVTAEIKDKTQDWQRSLGDKMQDLGKNIKDKGDDMKKIA